MFICGVVTYVLGVGFVKFEDITSRTFYESLISEVVGQEFPKDLNTVWVSEIARCLRQSYLVRVKPKSFLGPQLVKVFIGRLVHEGIESLLKSKYEVVTELRVEYPVDDFKVVGRVDALSLGGEEVILEFKVVGEVPQEPYLDHVRQVRYYSVLTNVRRGVIVYITRDGDILPYIIKCGDTLKVKDELVGRARELRRALKYSIPPKPERSTSCSGCPYRLECFK